MEWVEITAKTVEEATQQSLEQLGVDEADAELEVLEEPRPGLFGRMRGEARVRARVAPREQRPKQERRSRRKGGGSGSGADRGRQRQDPNGAGSRQGSGRRADTPPAAAKGPDPKESKGKNMDDIVTVTGQADIMQEFLEGLVGAFGIDGRVERVEIDDETIELDVTGDELGLLIGLKGQTLSAVQDLARTYLQRTATGVYEGRVRIDVAGYRQRRREALERFVGDVATTVRTSGTQKALEPMGPADRKVVHDTVNGLEGVRTLSEGQDPRRRVVIIPDSV